MKTVKQDEPISRSRFVDCPVCKNHTLKVKRTLQVGRCKSCNETYKVIVVYVKTERKAKSSLPNTQVQSETRPEIKPESTPVSSSPSESSSLDSSLFGTSTNPYAGLSEAVFGESHKEEKSESGSSGGQ